MNDEKKMFQFVNADGTEVPHADPTTYCRGCGQDLGPDHLGLYPECSEE